MSQMATETIIDIETVVDDLTDHEFDTCCDFITHGEQCGKRARWIMHRVRCCTAYAHPALACTPCKDLRMLSDAAVRCYGCDYVTAPARMAYTYIEPIDGK